MSVIQRKPFIQNVLDTLGDKKADLLDLVNGSDKTPEFRSLINQSALITGSDKNKVQYVNLETWAKTYSGYLIYNNSYCVLVAFTSNTQALVMLDINATKSTYKVVKEYLDINELRRYLEEADDHIVASEIDSGSATADQVLAADGDGGAEWKDVMDVITPETVESGDAVQLFGFDSEGNLVKDDIPEGILVDKTIIEDSPNAVDGGAVYDALQDIDAELETKANVDGNYPTLTVGVADQLSPYDEDSGDDQDEPFILQGTGTANGTQSDFSTGAIALMREKQGNTVVVNQLAKEINSTNYYYQDATVTYSSGVATLTATSSGGSLAQSIGTIVAGHKYFVSANIKLTTATTKVSIQFRDGTGVLAVSSTQSTTNPQIVCGIVEARTSYSSAYYRIIDERDSDFDAIEISNTLLIDLTQWFNGDIPQDILDNPSNFFRYYQGSLAYNQGELVNANGRYIKCIGRQQWDEEWEVGGISGGTPYTDNTKIRSKNYISVIPNSVYYIKANSDVKPFFYDKDKNYISSLSSSYNFTITIPSNACYMKFHIANTSTYANDITVSLYYEDESGYDQYYPYQVLTNNDTGTETLRKAGSVKDTKAPDGTIHRRIGVVDLGSLNWDTYSSPETHVFRTALSGITNIKPATSATVKANAITPGYELKDMQSLSASENMTFAVGHIESGRLTYINHSYSSASDFKTAMNGVYLFYELAEPTTEQGTPYSENLVIDDFGSMDFQGTSGVPQGNLIFYPVDYKAFVDTLYNYTEGTPSNIALKTDLASDKSELKGVDTQLLNAIGGTLRQCLCVKESLDFDNTDFVDLGSLTWVRTNNGGAWNNYVFYASVDGIKVSTAKVISTIFGTTATGVASIENKAIKCSGTSIIIRDDSYTSADTFKNSMKNVLLAYEKASE